ncbi:arylacetamide deacetylase-like 4 [Paroedura picta]|uniref:arylacetamide deacetylase-like 4 n=1 Tax=Paroedura picta TaxID=143630 RepID=UPI00405689B6
MGPIRTVLALLAVPLLFPFLLGWAVYYQLSTVSIPAGIDEGLKLRLLHLLIAISFGLDYICWKMGLCNRLTILRFIVDGIPPLRDPKLSIKDDFIKGVPVRSYQPKRPSTGLRRGILFFHGGGGVLGSIDLYERLCRYIAKESDSVLLSVGYHLAPESSYPSQFKECLEVTIHFMQNSENYGVDPARIILSGDSFGGTLTAYLCQELKGRSDLPSVRAQVLIYPFLQGLDFNLPSYQQYSHVPILSQKHVAYLSTFYFDAPSSIIDMIVSGQLFPDRTIMKYREWVRADLIPPEFQTRNHPPALPASRKINIIDVLSKVLTQRLSPLLADDSFFKGLPEAFILTCEYDVLRDDGLLYKKRLEDNGVLVSWYHFEGGFHACLCLLHHWLLPFSTGKKGADSIVNYVKCL